MHRTWVHPLAIGLIMSVPLGDLAGVVRADDATPDAKWRDQMASRERMTQEYAKLIKDDQCDEAAKLAEDLIVADRELLSSLPPDANNPMVVERIERQIPSLVKWLADRDCQRDDWSAAIRREQELTKFLEQLHGKDDYRVGDARRRGKYYALFRSLPLADARQLVTADEQYEKGCTCCDHRDYRTGMPLANKALEVYRRLLGEDCMQTADCVSLVAVLDLQQAHYDQAEPLLVRACAIYKQILGENYPDYGESLTNLADLYKHRGDHARAEVVYRQARDVFKRAGRENHASYAMVLYCLGNIHFEDADYGRAEALYREAWEIRKRVLPHGDVNLSSSANSLANVYQVQGQYAMAVNLYTEACDIIKRAWGDEHPGYAGALDNLACTYLKMKDYEKAEPLFKKAIAIMKKAFGENHPEYAMSISRLAMLYHVRGDSDRAVPLYEQVAKIRRQTLGPNHRMYAESLKELAFAYVDQGNDVQAEPLYREATAIARKFMESTSAIQSEQRQLFMLGSVRPWLDGYLSLVVRTNDYVEPAYQELLAWKGSVSRRRRQMRTVSDSAELKPIFAQLQQVVSQLSQMAWALPTPAQYKTYQSQMAQLSAEKDRLEGELSMRSAAYRQARRQITVKDVQAALPSDTVLLDFFEYWQYTPPDKNAQTEKSWDQRLVAFVVTHDRPVEMVSLGTTQKIGQAIDAWRESFGSAPLAQSAARYLRRCIWQPLEPKLGRSQTVLISPDGQLGRLPFGVLPGRQPGSYLLEERTFAVVPIPQLIPELTEEEAHPHVQKRLLLVGDVDYDALPSESDEKSSSADTPAISAVPIKLMHFSPLDGTKGEVRAIEKLYHDHFGEAGITTLVRSEASKRAFLSAASKHRYLHVATHGYFLSQDAGILGLLMRRSEAGGQHPALLSGLALAGANRANRGDVTTAPAADDGLLTAEEIGATSMEGVQLVVLSACETGLGETAAGEGLLGLQRAFQSAGARTVVASLWPVPDRPTQQLMARFYANQWHEKMSPLQALREAQLWMLHGAADSVGTAKDVRQSPQLWAAFVISGDWH